MPFGIVLIVLVIYLVQQGFKWLTGETQREREEEQRREQERRRQEGERERKEAAERQAEAEAKKQFEQSILNGEFPSSKVLSILRDSFDHIPENIKEALEELLWGTCTLREMDYYDAVRLIRQRGRIGERARQRTARVGLPGDDPDRPLAEPEAFALLGVAAGCTSEELAHAYHLTMSQWHPDKLEMMAPELREYATRRTVRNNEAYQLVKSTTVRNRASGE
jgi:hypothetical protein